MASVNVQTFVIEPEKYIPAVTVKRYMLELTQDELDVLAFIGSNTESGTQPGAVFVGIHEAVKKYKTARSEGYYVLGRYGRNWKLAPTTQYGHTNITFEEIV